MFFFVWFVFCRRPYGEWREGFKDLGAEFLRQSDGYKMQIGQT